MGYVAGDAAGFKPGYTLDEDSFYSWLGGVLPEYRKRASRRHYWTRSKARTLSQRTLSFSFPLMLALRQGLFFYKAALIASGIAQMRF